MALDTDTKKTEKPLRPDLDHILDLYWGGPERRITGLTLRIIGVNFIALIALMIGVLYLGEYEQRQIEVKLGTFGTQTQLIAAAFSENIETPNKNTPSLNLKKSQNMALHFSRITGQRVYIFGPNGKLLIDSKTLPGGEKALNRQPPYSLDPEFESIKTLKSLARFFLQLLPDRKTLPRYPEKTGPDARFYPDASHALHGNFSITAWETGRNNIILSAAVPLTINDRMAGAVMLTRDGQDIIRDIGDVWLSIVQIFLATLIATVLLSIYLSGTIARPLKKLTSAAEALRLNKKSEIPDLSERNDEIGELSLVLRGLTKALQDRMDNIEKFAADVAHELKNPLTSLKSATETLSKVTKKKDREKLMGILHHDIERLDRLITDISQASRLDSELAREDFEQINLTRILKNLTQRHNDIAKQNKTKITITFEQTLTQDIYIWAIESRLVQVFDNLLSNALSFSGSGDTIRIKAHSTNTHLSITIEDQGPGIPSGKLESIFERFYSERPAGETYGSHSGLGLSICRKIIETLGGQIFADNIKDGDTITGARLTVILKTTAKK